MLNFIFADFEGMSDRVEQISKSWFAYKLILPVQFSLGQFYVAKTRSYGRIVPGVNCGKNNNLSLKENTSPKKNFIPDTIVGRRGSSTFTCLIGTFTFNVTGVWLENDLLVFAIGSHGGPPDAGGLPQKVVHLGCFKNI